MRKDKWNRVLASYDGFAGPATVSAILDQIPAELKSELTGRQLGLVMKAVNSAYHNGRVAAEGEIAEYVSVPEGKTLWDWLTEKSES
jgi:hypothetical protein